MEISYGLHITQPNDPLQRVQWEQVVRKIADPPQALKQQVQLLRQIRTIEPRKYQELKRELPYFCCSLFSPSVRRKENFVSISSLVIDLDHLNQTHNLQEVRDTLKQDPGVGLIYLSPGSEGLKVAYWLKSPCLDEGLYSYLYKSYVKQFADRYHLHDVIDWKVHDVTRANFLSVDPDVYYNPNAEPIDLDGYMQGMQEEGMREQIAAFQEYARQQSKEEVHDEPTLTDEVLEQIKKSLDPQYRKTVKKEIYQPAQLDQVLPDIERVLKEHGILIESIKPIHYGKQIRVTMSPYWAEVNVFYGKKGYSVVPTTKSGSQKELAQLVFQLLDQFFYSSPF